jgi:hypothetical protein
MNKSTGFFSPQFSRLETEIRNYNLKLENYLGYKPNFITLYLKQKIWYYNLKLEIIIF